MKKDSIFSTIFSIFSTNIFVIGLVVIAGIILPRLLSPTLLGELNSLTALAAIIYSFTFLGMRSSMIMHLGKKNMSEDKILLALQYIFLLSTLLSTSALIIFFFFVSDDQFTFTIILLVCLLNPFEFILSYMQGYNLAKGKIGKFNRLNWIPKIVYLVGIIIFIFFFHLNVRGALLSIILANLLTIIIYLHISKFSFRIFPKNKIPVNAIMSLIGYGSLYALALLITRLNHKIDILLLKRLSTLAEVGYYSLGVSLAEIIWQVPMAASLVLMTRSAKETDQKSVSRQISSTLRISLILVIAAAIVLYAIAPQLVQILFGDRYTPSIPVIRTILPGILFYVILLIINSQFIGTGKPQLTLIALLPALIINIVLNIILIPEYKGVGAAMATNISYFVASLVLVFIYSRTFKISLSEIFTYRKSDFRFLKKNRFW